MPAKLNRVLIMPFIKEPSKNFKRRSVDDEDEYILEPEEGEEQKQEEPEEEPEDEDDFNLSSSSSSDSSDDDSDDEYEDDDESSIATEEFDDDFLKTQGLEEDQPITPKAKAKEEDQTLWGIIQQIRKWLADRRRHRGLRYFERQYREELEAKAKDERRRRLQLAWATTRNLEKAEETSKVKALLARIRRTDAIRFARDNALRCRRRDGGLLMLDLFTKWDLERKHKSDNQAEQNRKRLEREAREAQIAARKAAEEADMRQRLNEIADTQTIMKQLRRNGTYPGVNPTAPLEDDLPVETDYNVVIRPRPGAVLAVLPRFQMAEQSAIPRINYFNVDLIRFRSVVKLKGEGLGAEGAIALARDMEAGCLQKMEVLDLRGSRIGRLGLDALSAVFRKSLGATIHTLDLRYNDLTGRSMKAFSEAIMAGGLPQLRSLDLRSNELKDHGAAILATALSKGAFKKLEVLYLQKNDIGDQGVLAIYRCMQGNKKVVPSIKAVHLRQNPYNNKIMKHMPYLLPYLDL